MPDPTPQNRDIFVRLISRTQLVSLLVGMTLACDEGPSGLSTGNLSIAVSGLPAGSPPALVVTGPGGYSQGVAAAQVLTSLVPGTYTVAAHAVTVGSVLYIGVPETQSIAVGGSTASASVHYSTTAGNLSVTITGLGTNSDASVTVTGPDGYSSTIASSQTLASLTPGTYTISAQDVVANGGTLHSPAPATQDVTVPVAGTASATVSYAPPNSGPLNLRIAGLYLTQSAQTFAGGVPLVKDRNGYLRVFAVANRTNTSVPAVRVRIYNSSDVVVQDVVIPAPSLTVPTSVDESTLANSWNTAVPGSRIQPGFRIEAEVDPAGTVTESDEADNLVAPPAPLVQTVPTLNVTFVPIIQSNGLTGNVTAANKDAFLISAQKMHPLPGYDAIVHSPVTANTTDTLEDDNSNNAWTTLLSRVDAIRIAEGTSRYYYGVAKVSYNSGVAGVAYVSGTNGERSALGWDYLPSGAAVAAHELGHNWGRNHAPCGGPGGVDNAYPQPDGTIGVFGLDVADQSLKPASTSDIMGYCDPKWIGDYTYKGVMNYLISPPTAAPVAMSGMSQAVQPCLLVWGHIRNGEMMLEPSFQVTTRPTLPTRPGPYTLEARAEDGSNLFTLSFSPNQVADAPGTQQSFVFAVPLADAQVGRLASLRLRGQGREAVRMPTIPGTQLGAGKVETARLRRMTGGRLGVQWDAVAHPMVMVRDAETGEVLSFATGGSIEVASLKREVDIVLSDGVRSRVKRLSVRP
jgi:hypothetical protein